MGDYLHPIIILFEPKKSPKAFRLFIRRLSLFFVMAKWADYLISRVSYDRNHLIKTATRHQDTEKGITKGTPIDRLAVASDIKNGLTYITVYSSKNSWKKGHKIETFSIGGEPYLRIDENKVKLDFLGDLPESPIIVEESEPEPKTTSESEPEPQSPRGPLPQESSEELPQELDLAPEPVTEETVKTMESSLEPEEEEATEEQLSYLEKLQEQINDLEGILQSQSIEPEPEPEEEEATPEQFSQLELLQDQIDELEKAISNNAKNQSSKNDSTSLNNVKELEKEIEKLEAADVEHDINQKLQKQNKKLDAIENKLRSSPKTTEKTVQPKNIPEAYCVKCKTKRKISQPEETVMKNGRPAIKGRCSVCNCKVYRIGKMK